ncbi:hypothetical protein GCM10022224_061500 [Nonomuraea antimicrobica]|uniref:Secreted protein n=1 Tax=Nonomuraea antimicrobica TaxID=561173 RepID=A0ABP7CD68_9ACTN
MALLILPQSGASRLPSVPLSPLNLTLTTLATRLSPHATAQSVARAGSTPEGPISSGGIPQNQRHPRTVVKCLDRPTA